MTEPSRKENTVFTMPADGDAWEPIGYLNTEEMPVTPGETSADQFILDWNRKKVAYEVMFEPGPGFEDLFWGFKLSELRATVARWLNTYAPEPKPIKGWYIVSAQRRRTPVRGFSVRNADGTVNNYVQDDITGEAMTASEWFDHRRRGGGA